MNKYLRKAIIFLTISQTNIIIIIFGLYDFISIWSDRFAYDTIFVILLPLELLFFVLSIVNFVKIKPTKLVKGLMIAGYIMGGLILLFWILITLIILGSPSSARWQGW